MIHLTYNPIDTEQLLAAASQRAAGAVVLFLGITREFTGSEQTVSLDYEAYEPMAEKELAALEAEACKRWPLVHCSIVHRLGNVPLTEASVAIVASSPHRPEAFEAARWLIDTLKELVPIWKKEHQTTGESHWVHPGKLEK